ncbi:MAG: iron-containing alcohol dehydrogenase [Pseudonocardiaceae bacterium]|nr:iron-containing alcohol dehydrogenase [Pseudonocardiaceae bacterium]
MLGPLAVARFDGAIAHTPVDVTRAAMAVVAAHDVDCVVAVGGGATVGLAKALAVRTGVDQVVLPTTYAGSEMTPVLGETEDGRKTTRTSAHILPETVVYDVALSIDLPRRLSVTSGVNALAHAVEARYAPAANPAVDSLAARAISGIATALPRIHADGADLAARVTMLESAWLAGTCLATVGMGLHHQLCHVLGGAFDLPHADLHAVVLPHAMAYNADAVPEVMAEIAADLGVSEAAAGVFDLVHTLDGPTSLAELGLTEADLMAVAEQVAADPYPNPRGLTVAGVAELLRDAWQGNRPGGGTPRRRTPDLERLTEQVVDSFAAAPDPRGRHLMTDLVRTLHGYAVRNDLTEDEWLHGIEFLTRTGQLCDDTRQEFVLLSDTLGVSSVVDMLTNSRTPATTPSAVLGPFYVAGPPEVEPGGDLAAGLPGAPLWSDITVTDPSDTPLAGAVVDVWQSNEDGFYDVQLPELAGPALRARLRTDTEGKLTFWSILPAEYPIPDDGPVGHLLAAVGRHPYRAPHLHFMITAPGHRRLITQLFVRGGAYLDSDTVFGVKDDLIVDFVPQHGPTPDGRQVDGEWYRLDYTFRLGVTN